MNIVLAINKVTNYNNSILIAKKIGCDGISVNIDDYFHFDNLSIDYLIGHNYITLNYVKELKKRNRNRFLFIVIKSFENSISFLRKILNEYYSKNQAIIDIYIENECSKVKEYIESDILIEFLIWSHYCLYSSLCLFKKKCLYKEVQLIGFSHLKNSYKNRLFKKIFSRILLLDNKVIFDPVLKESSQYIDSEDFIMTESNENDYLIYDLVKINDMDNETLKNIYTYNNLIRNVLLP